MTVKLRELEVLHAVVKTGTMSAAARQLHTSQPAVSQTVRSIEQHLGVSLFERDGNRVTPTQEVLELFSELDLVFSSVESARRLAAVLHQGAGRVLRLGAIPSLSAAFVPQAMATLRQAFPHVRVWIRSQEPMMVRDSVIRREFDLGIMYAEQKRDGIDLHDLCSAPMLCLLREDDPLVEQPVLTTAQLADQPLISHTHMSPIGEDLDDIFERDGFTRRLVVQLGNSHSAAGFVRCGLGIALVDPFFLGVTPLDGLVVRPFSPFRMLTPRLIHVSGRQLSEIEETFFQHLKSTAQQWVHEHAAQLALQT